MHRRKTTEKYGNTNETSDRRGFPRLSTYRRDMNSTETKRATNRQRCPAIRYTTGMLNRREPRRVYRLPLKRGCALDLGFGLIFLPQNHVCTIIGIFSNTNQRWTNMMLNVKR